MRAAALRAQSALRETVSLLNEELPRPSLGGVTPADVHHGRKEVKRQEIQAYREKEESRQEIPAWTRGPPDAAVAPDDDDDPAATGDQPGKTRLLPLSSPGAAPPGSAPEQPVPAP